MEKRKYTEWRKYENKATTITIGNYKGGVGKTTNTVLIGYTLANLGIRTLVIDLDPQSNATKALLLTKLSNSADDQITTIDKTLMRGIQENDLLDLPVEIIPNLDLLPSFIDFEDFPKYLYQHTSTEWEEDHFLSKLLEPVKERYDMILIDVPPMSIEVTKNAVVSSDYVLISLQTQERSLTGAENYIEQLQKLQELYDLDLEVVGVLPVLQKNKGSVDQYILENARELFGNENMFQTIVPQMERIKRFDVSGITNEDRHDERVLDLYMTVTKELLTRLAQFHQEGE